MKTYTITLSKVFPVTHPKRGEDTDFRRLFLEQKKIHTIRSNYGLWKKRFDAINDGEAILSVRQWQDKPYASKQELVKDLTIENHIGIQELVFLNGDVTTPRVVYEADLFNPERKLVPYDIRDLAANDGLSVADWLDWFKCYDLTKPLAIIQFSSFRYLPF